MLRTLVLATVVLGLTVTSAVSAERNREPVQVNVSARAVNFNNATEVAAFRERLLRAARMACDSHIPRQLDAVMSDARCARESLDRAVAQLDRPTLTAWHEHNLPGAGDRRLTLARR